MSARVPRRAYFCAVERVRDIIWYDRWRWDVSGVENVRMNVQRATSGGGGCGWCFVVEEVDVTSVGCGDSGPPCG